MTFKNKINSTFEKYYYYFQMALNYKNAININFGTTQEISIHNKKNTHNKILISSIHNFNMLPYEKQARCH